MLTLHKMPGPLCLQMNFLLNGSMFRTKTWMWERRDPDGLWLVWSSLSSPRVWCQDKCYATIPHCMYSVFTQEAQVWVSHQNLCQLGFSHSQTCCTTNCFPPICLSEWATSIDSNILRAEGGGCTFTLMPYLHHFKVSKVLEICSTAIYFAKFIRREINFTWKWN